MTDLENRWSADERRLSRLLRTAVDDLEPVGPAPTAAARPDAPAGEPARRRRWILVAVPAIAACAVAAVVAGIGLAGRDESAPAAPTPAPTTSTPPVQPAVVLQGKWAVQLPADDQQLMASVVGDRFTISDSACSSFFSFSTHSDGLISFVGLLQTSPPACSNDDRRIAPSRATAFEVVSANEFVLRSETGDPLAIFQRAGVLGDGEPVEDTVGVAPLPSGLHAPSVDEVLGTWLLAGGNESTYWVRFESRTWTWKSDCNVHGAGFLLSAWGGLLDVGPGSPSDQACAREDAWVVDRTMRLGKDGGQLVLFAEDGAQLVRLERAGPDGAADPAPSAVQDPGVLLGTWRAELAELPDEPITMTFDAEQVRIRDGDCETSRPWTAHSDGLLLLAPGYPLDDDRVCEQSNIADYVPTLLRFRAIDPSTVELYGPDAAAAATMTRVGAPGMAASGQITAALPEGLSAPVERDLLGPWAEVGPQPSDLVLDRGTWSQTRGTCTWRGGAFAVSDRGGLLVGSYSALPAPGCAEASTGRELPRASRLGLDGVELVLLDADGRELTRFERAGP